MKNDSFVASRRDFSRQARSSSETHRLLSNNSFKQIFMVSFRRLLVNNEVMPNVVRDHMLVFNLRRRFCLG